MTGHYVIYRIKVLPPYSFHLTCVSITNNTSHSHSPVCQCSSVPRISPCRLVDCQTGSCSIRKYVNLLRGNKQPPFLSAGQHVTVFVHRRKIFFGRQLSQMYQFAWLSPSPCCHPLLCFSLLHHPSAPPPPLLCCLLTRAISRITVLLCRVANKRHVIFEPAWGVQHFTAVLH